MALCDRVIIIDKGILVADDNLENLLGKQQANDVILELKETVTKDIFENIQHISVINATTWRFKTDDADALRKRLLEISLQKNLNIISLRTDTSQSLENVFRNLTGKNL